MSQLHRRRVVIDPLEFSSANQRRTPGLHMTDVIKDMLLAAGIGKKHKSAEAGGFSQNYLRAFQAQGYSWEDVFFDVLAPRVLKREGYMRLPEIAYNPQTGHAFWVEYDGDGNLLTPIPLGYYVCSPDGGRLEVELPAPRFSLVEIKWTIKSANMNPEIERPDWFYQAPGYLGALSAVMGQPIGRVEWQLFFPCATRWGEAPIYEEWEREYSQGEVADIWSAVDAHARWRVKNDDDHPWRQWL